MPVFYIEEKISLRTWYDIFDRLDYQSLVGAHKFRFLRIAEPSILSRRKAPVAVSVTVNKPIAGVSWSSPFGGAKRKPIFMKRAVSV